MLVLSASQLPNRYILLEGLSHFRIFRLTFNSLSKDPPSIFSIHVFRRTAVSLNFLLFLADSSAAFSTTKTRTSRCGRTFVVSWGGHLYHPYRRFFFDPKLSAMESNSIFTAAIHVPSLKGGQSVHFINMKDPTPTVCLGGRFFAAESI